MSEQNFYIMLAVKYPTCLSLPLSLSPGRHLPPGPWEPLDPSWLWRAVVVEAAVEEDKLVVDVVEGLEGPWQKEAPLEPWIDLW